MPAATSSAQAAMLSFCPSERLAKSFFICSMALSDLN
jgi:hypothetical protein